MTGGRWIRLVDRLADPLTRSLAGGLLEALAETLPQLIRYPAIDPDRLRDRVVRFLKAHDASR